MAKKKTDKNITINSEELIELRNIESEMTTLRLNVSDIVQELERVKVTFNERLKTLQTKQDNYVARINALATSYGIDIEDPSKGRWNFDSGTGIFSKVT